MITRKRCAIYCRKSTDENLDSEFNSLDAQRESGESYIASQKSNGWVCLPEKYDDGGFSGGNTNRPALQKLLEDCETGLIDIIVVYKIDRLSRSICDFTDLSKKFDELGIQFVSVTQEINTASPAGRMMLNILITFSQFEREQIAERVKFKMSASRKKGKWVGGCLPYGYKVENKKLVPNLKEIDLIKHIFQRYIEIQSVKLIAVEINQSGFRTHKGKLWNSSHIYRLLNNHTYIGEVKYEGNICAGEHEAIIERNVWNRVHEIMKSQNRNNGKNDRIKTIAPLKGILRCGHCDSAMAPAYTTRNGKKYHYYSCVKSNKSAISTCPIKQIAAGEIEKLIRQKVSIVLSSPVFMAKISELTGENVKTLSEIFNEDFWNELSPGEYYRLIELLVQSAVIFDNSLEIVIKTNGMRDVMEDFLNA